DTIAALRARRESFELFHDVGAGWECRWVVALAQGHHVRIGKSEFLAQESAHQIDVIERAFEMTLGGKRFVLADADEQREGASAVFAENRRGCRRDCAEQ